MEVSVVIPTCNRKARLLGLLASLSKLTFPLSEVIIVDSGDDQIVSSDYDPFKNLKVIYLRSEKSVCIQRNLGIKHASASWIFFCDDDIEVPADYLEKLVEHVNTHPETGAVSGLFLQKGENDWTEKYSIKESSQLVWRFIFGLSIWGEIDCKSDNLLLKKIKNHYQKKGNHISKAGWPVITDFSGSYFSTPVYSLGASLVKKEWLANSLFDEVLDPHGIGDNYGVASGFPAEIHVVNGAHVYHHREPVNRLQKPLQYFRRVLVLDYFIRTKKNLRYIKKGWFLWSLMGNFISFVFSRDMRMVQASYKSLVKIVFGKNPYCQAVKLRQRIVEATFSRNY